MDITTQGKCEVCGNDIIMAKWVADIAQPTTCSRKCADKKLAESKEENMTRGVKREKPSKEELTQVYINGKQQINPVAKYYKIDWTLAKNWLKEAGLIDAWNKPIVEEEKELDQAERDENKQDVEEISSDQEKPVIECFTSADEAPIDYVPNTYILEHHLVTEEIAALLDSKRHDYGTNNIRKFGSLGCLIRASDKVERLINLRDKPSIYKEDAWLDLAGYAVLGLIESRAGR